MITVKTSSHVFTALLLLLISANSFHRASIVMAQEAATTVKPVPLVESTQAASSLTPNAETSNIESSSIVVAQPASESVDLSITGIITARELRFDVVPNPKVEFTGRPNRITVFEAERQNLPRPVQPGVTYRDIGVQLTITSVFADIDRIVAEALGQQPISDDTPRNNNNTAPTNNPAPSSTQPSSIQPSSIQPNAAQPASRSRKR